MQDAMLHYIRIAFAAQAHRQGGDARRRQSVSGTQSADGIFPCKGGGPNDYVYVFTSRANPEHWRRLLKVIGREDLIGDPRYDTGGGAPNASRRSTTMIADWTRQHDKHEAMACIGAAGVPAGAVLDTMELINDPTFEQRGIMQTIEHPTAGPFRMPAWPVRFDGRPPPVKPSPLLGEHTKKCLATGSALTPTRSSNSAKTASSKWRERNDMAELTGSEILAKCLKKEGIEDMFYIMGGPMLLAEATCINEGIRMIDVRHEQAAAFMGQAYSRLLQKPSVCMAASGPGVINLITGIANALIDCCPVVAFGGSSPISQFGRQVFQEIDQVALMQRLRQMGRPRLQPQAHPASRSTSRFQNAMTGKPGPVYLDLPGDILYQKIDENQVDWSFAGRPIAQRAPARRSRAGRRAGRRRWPRRKQPIIVSGTGVIWSQRLDRDAGSSSRRPASRSTPRRKAAAWCRTIIRTRS